MNAEQASKLKVGNRVMWNNIPTDLGTVVLVGGIAVEIKWDNGQEGIIDFNDTPIISLAPNNN